MDRAPSSHSLGGSERSFIPGGRGILSFSARGIPWLPAINDITDLYQLLGLSLVAVAHKGDLHRDVSMHFAILQRSPNLRT